MNDEIRIEMAKLKRQVQYKNADESILEKAAEKNVVLKELIDSGNFINDAEKKLAKKSFESYLAKLDFENVSDLSTLSTLVYNEILSKRLEKSINKCTNKDGESYISDKLLKSHADLTNQILNLKTKLGIDKDVKEDEFTSLQLLKKRFNNWLQENKSECTIAVPFECPKCNHSDVKMVFLRKRVKDFEAIDHAWFAGRFYINKYLLQMVEDGKMTVEDCAKAHKVSVDHIKFTLENKGRYISNTEESK